MNSKYLVKIGVLGVASIATRSVIPAILTLPEHYKLIGVASRDQNKSKKMAEALGSTAFTSYESLLAEPDLQAVYVPLPNSLHYQYVKMALECGKHVLVEKSLGCNVREVLNLVELARSKGLVVLENFQFRFHSQLSTILKYIYDGHIGDLRSVRVGFGFPPFPDPKNIRYNLELGGGALLDVGAYAIKIAPLFLGDDVNVVQASMYFDTEKGVDIWGGGVIQQINGPLFCQFAYGFDHYYQCSLELWGSKGKISTNRIFTAPPGFKPKIQLETSNGLQECILSDDDHFRNILEYFHRLIHCESPREAEYTCNIQQATLIDDFKSIAAIR